MKAFFADFAFYKGELHFTCEDQRIYNIIQARICLHQMNHFITLEKNRLRMENTISDWNTRKELVWDLLLFMNKQLTLLLPVPLEIHEERTDEISYVIQIKRSLYIYRVDITTWEEQVTPLFASLMRAKSSSPFRFLYLCDYPLNKEEVRTMDIQGIKIPLFEPFMKQKLHVANNKYLPAEQAKNEIILEDGTRKSACFSCVHRLHHVSNRGCLECKPRILQKEKTDN